MGECIAVIISAPGIYKPQRASARGGNRYSGQEATRGRLMVSEEA